MKKYKLTIAITVLAIMALLTSCDVNPDSSPEFILTDMKMVDQGFDSNVIILDTFNGRNADVSFPGSSSIVFTVEGKEHKGTYTALAVKKKSNQDDDGYGHYSFKMDDGTSGTFRIARFAFDGEWYLCEVTYNNVVYYFTDKHYEEDETSLYDEWKQEHNEDIIKNKVSSINNYLALSDSEQDANTLYKKGKIVRNGSTFSFIPDDGGSEKALNLAKCYFYSFTGDNLQYSESIKVGTALLTENSLDKDICAIIYLDTTEIK